MPRSKFRTSHGKMGDQIGYSLYIPPLYPATSSDNTITGLPAIPEVPPFLANIEAEKGETIMGDFDGDGMPEHFRIAGKSHADGGTFLNAPDGSFVFSNTAKLKLGGPVLREFGKSPTTSKKFTPAALARQYDINQYKKVLDSLDSDTLDRGTAELMIDNNSRKLGKLALAQEAIKGFPTGIPEISQPLLMTSPPQMKRGGPVKPVDPHKGDKQAPRKYQQDQLNLRRGFNRFAAPWLKEYGYPDTPQGLDDALLTAGYQGDLNNVREVQQFLIAENLRRGNKGLFSSLLKKYGMTNQGIDRGLGESTDTPGFDQSSLEKIFADNMFGVRSGLMLKELLDKDLKPSTVKVPTIPYNIGKPNTNLLPSPPTQQFPPSQEQYPKPVSPRPDDAMPWWTQDMINTGAALGNRYNLKKYMPTYVTPGVALPDPTFYDPTRQLAATQEQAATQTMVAGMYAGPQRLRSVGSDIQGQAGVQAANILAQVQNQNVDVANQFSGIRSQLLTDKSRQDATARKTYVDELATVNQQYDNSVRQAGDVLRGNLINGMTNAQRTYWLNQFTPQFKIDSSTGRIAFTRGKDLGDAHPGAEAPNPLDSYKNFYDQFLKKIPDPQKAHEFAQRMAFGSRSRFQANSDGESEMTTSGYGMNPMALQLLGMYAPHFLSR